MNNRLLSLILGCAAAVIPATAFADSILDIRHSITDENVVPPESFETRTRELEENFYIRNFVVSSGATDGDNSANLGSAAEYERRLASLPTVIEMPYNDVVGRLINMYLGRRRGLVSNMLALHSYYGNIFLEELIREGMPTELQYLPVIESAINPNAVSRAGAAGLWQFMPATAKGLGMEVNSLVDERRDPRVSSRNAAKYLHQLYDIYEDWSLAIAAYNCGPGNVNKALRRAGGGKKDFWEIYNYLPQETRGYVPAFIAANYVMNFYDKHNIAPTVVRRHLTTDTVQVNHRVHFQQIADVLNIPIDEIRMLNPQFRQDIIPGNFHPYTLTLPKQQCLSYLMSEDAILAHDAELYAQRTYVEPGGTTPEPPVDESGTRNLSAVERQSANADSNIVVAMTPVDSVRRVTHIVGRGESLRDVARHYGVSATDIKRWNHLRRGKIHEGDELIIELRPSATPDNLTLLAANTPSQRPASGGSDVPPPPARAQNNGQADVPAPPARQQPTPAPEPPAPPRQQTTRAPASSNSNSNAQASTSNTSRNNRQQANQRANDRNNRNNRNNNRTTSYTVRRGDTLEGIARANGCTVAELRQANGIRANSDRINIGQSLKIPKKNRNSRGSRRSRRR